MDDLCSMGLIEALQLIEATQFEFTILGGKHLIVESNGNKWVDTLEGYLEIPWIHSLYFASDYSLRLFW